MSSVSEIAIFGDPVLDAFAVCPRSGLSFIEQLQKSASKPCHYPPKNWLLGIDPETCVGLLMQPACKRWACPTCAARNARRWIARVLQGVNQLDGIWWMFTLTAHEKMRGQDASVLNLREGWKKVYNLARHNFGTAAYCKVWEMHGDGETFHLHGLVDRNWGERWLKDTARKSGMGYQVDIHHVDNAGQVAGYIAKYFLKSEGVLNEGNSWPKNLRRIEVSRNWPELPEMADFARFSWDVYQTQDGAQRAAAWKRQQGYRIVDLLPA